MNKPIAIITGASTGIGRSLAIKFSSKYLVYLISRNQQNLIQTKELIEANNGECKLKGRNNDKIKCKKGYCPVL